MARDVKRSHRKSVRFPADVKEAERSIALDVNEFCLDYIACNALNSILALASWDGRGAKRNIYGQVKVDRQQPLSSEKLAAKQGDINNQLRLVDSFFTILKTNHPTHELSRTLTFRLKLLRFSALFLRATRPHASTVSPHHAQTSPDEPSSALQDLRRTNRHRARTWWDHRRASFPSLPFSQEQDVGDRVSNNINAIDFPPHASGSSESSTDDSNEGPDFTLLDILPLFISLTSDRTKLNSKCRDDDFTSSSRWLELALEFMIHAFLEQRLRCGAAGSTALLEAFAWGPITSKPPTVKQDDRKYSLASNIVDGDVGSGKVNTDDMALHNIFLLPDSLPNSPTSQRTSTDSDSHSLSPSEFDFLRERTLLHLDPLTYKKDPASTSPEELSEIHETLLEGANAVHAYPRDLFEQKVWQFCEGLGKSIEVPLLRQLEECQDGVRTTLDFEGRRLGIAETERLREMWATGIGYFEG